MSEVQMLELFLVSFESEISFEQNRMKRLLDVLESLDCAHTPAEQDVFRLMRNLVNQSQQAAEGMREDCGHLKEAVSRLRAKLPDSVAE
jgi:hypothetical protein